MVQGVAVAVLLATLMGFLNAQPLYQPSQIILFQLTVKDLPKARSFYENSSVGHSPIPHRQIS
jgi:hypothetical protein